jgi:hypothetical protein
MSWDEHKRRRAAIKAVLAHAEQHPRAGLPYDVLPEAQANFGSRRELLLALQYDWSQALWARVELLSLEVRKYAKLSDAGELARAAWAECAARHPVLRRLLDEHRDELAPFRQRENELISSPFVA